jgi:hypothetical protein
MSLNKLDPRDKDILYQTDCLRQILFMNEKIVYMLDKLQEIGLQNYYIGAGRINQTVFNYLSDLPLDYGIDDVDIVYFDTDLSKEKEERLGIKLGKLFSELDLKVDVVNEARVHLWYKDEFGFDIRPYVSVEDAINTWPTTVTAIGVRKEKGELKVYAPFGLNDLFSLTLRANKTMINEEIYNNKCKKWTKKWVDLKVIPWDEEIYQNSSRS